MKLTTNQIRAAGHLDGPALTLAVPGSGKTTLLLERIRILSSRHGIDPRRILTLTFSRSAAADMRRRLGNADCTVSTIHAFALELLRRSGMQPPRILKDFEQRRLVEAAAGRALSDEDYEALAGEIGLLYNRMLKRGQTEGFEPAFTNIFDVASEYHRAKRRHGVMDYDDMLLKAKSLLESSPRLCRAIVDRFTHIQIDEAQDTSRLQFAIVELILGPKRNLFLVADDDQSIYAFRGAYPEYLLRFRDRFPDAKLYYLDRNFRSDPYIVRAATRFIEDNSGRYAKSIEAEKPSAHRISLTEYPTTIERNDALFARLRETSEAGDSAAILFRNRLSCLSLIDRLDRMGLPFRTREGMGREYRHWIVDDLRSFMELAMIPDSEEAFGQIWYKMNAFISREMYEDIRGKKSVQSMLAKAASLPYLKKYQIATIEKTEEAFAELRTLRPYEAIHYIEIQLGYLAYLSGRFEKQMRSLRERLDSYKAVAKECADALSFFERLEYLSGEASSGSPEASVVLSTVHGSKGLEFDHVFLIDVNPGSFPSDRAGDLEEERRLFYVAMTRAKKRLYLMHAGFVNGAHNPRSVFVDRLVEQSADCLVQSLD